MRVLYVYNKHNTEELALLDSVASELGSLIEDVEVRHFEEVSSLVPITSTPALIIIREDLQGAQLLKEDDPENLNRLRVIAETYKAMQEEEKVIHGLEVNRIEYVLNNEIESRHGALKSQVSTLGKELVEYKLGRKGGTN